MVFPSKALSGILILSIPETEDLFDNLNLVRASESQTK